MSNIFQTPLLYLKGIGPDKAEWLKKELGIHNFGDLLYYFPFKHIDKSEINKVSDLNPQMTIGQFVGKVKAIEEAGEKFKRRIHVYISDGTGELELVWFKGIDWIKKQFQLGTIVVAYGRINFFNEKYSLAHPDFEILKSEAELKEKLRLDSVYSTTEKLVKRGINSPLIHQAIGQVLAQCHAQIPENLSGYILQNAKLISRKQSFVQIHFPDSKEDVESSKFRIKFEELFFNQLYLLFQKKITFTKSIGNKVDKAGYFFNEFYNNHLPFTLTNAQKRVVKEIHQDLKSGKQMNRLVQGDVGSGKTMVAFLCMLIMIDNGYQCCMLAPTEILATQHFLNFAKLTYGLGIQVKLLTGSTKQSERKIMGEELKQGSLHILVGTHAILEDWVKFKSLGIAIIDEQHRFGVAQRAKLWAKNIIGPHILVMTATPIPRTLAMTVYGDLDVSIIDELPPGRKEIDTKVIRESNRLRLNGFLREQIQLGRQIYVVYPLIEENEKLDLQSLQEGYDELLRAFPIPEYQFSMVHGKLTPAEKESEMQRFKKGHSNIMVSTTVIEVGVDVPNASVMVIENAERFGLSQLHQLRGRVGRGSEKSYCFLMAGDKLSKDGYERLHTMATTNDGFKIAEKDLELRGPGDISGTRQSGLLEFRMANLATDSQILSLARNLALDVLNDDPELEKESNQNMKKYALKKINAGSEWSMIS